ncbi:DUF6890 family protein [Vibrio diazotrophicus]
MRRYFFPDGDDEPQNLARALWLDEHIKEREEIAIMNAISRLFKK